jgi:predicted DNA-binding protein (MmcQ/YjbR family)
MMPRQDRLRRAESALRNHALSYPETHEDFPWGHRALKVKGKAFLFMALGKKNDNVFSLSVKLPLSARDAVTLPFASPTPYGLGKSGWVTARFVAGNDVPLDMLREWIDESFRAIAPSRVLETFEHQADAPKKRPKRTGARRTAARSRAAK